jgi:GT2 family glycosyltransferase
VAAGRAPLLPTPYIYTQLTTDKSVEDKSHITQISLAQDPRAPMVSVVIPVYNALDFAVACVESFFSAKTKFSFEIILVDNGSKPDVEVWMRSLAAQRRSVTAIRVTSNLGYGGGINLGVRWARGDFLLLANSDTVFTDYAVDHLVEAMIRVPTIGVCSPVTNYVGEGPQLIENAEQLKVADAQQYAAAIRDCEGIVIAPERIAFFCVMVRRTIFQLLNGLDEAFGVGNFEDENFGSRVQLLGLDLAIIQKSFVFHHGSKTFEVNAIEHNKWMTLNAALYQNRLADIATNPSLLAIAIRAKSNSVRPRSAPSKPRISVLVRTRNRVDKLRHALTSLAMQTFTDFEVVVVNDAGEDVAPLLQKFEPCFPIQYVRHDVPRMAAEASNTALSLMRGDYFIHLDDDDIVYPFHLALFNQLIEAQPQARVAYSGHSRVLMEEEDGVLLPIQRVGIPFWRFDAEALLASNYVVIHASLFHREVYETVGLYTPNLLVLQDWDYLIRASKHYEFVPVNRVTCEYRFYKSLSNSLINRRAATRAEMAQIYDTHPTTRRSTEIERQHMLMEYDQQIQMIERLRDEVAQGKKTQERANAEILHRLQGFALPDPIG